MQAIGLLIVALLRVTLLNVTLLLTGFSFNKAKGALKAIRL
jgi:hypothetical protein